MIRNTVGSWLAVSLAFPAVAEEITTPPPIDDDGSVLLSLEDFLPASGETRFEFDAAFTTTSADDAQGVLRLISIGQGRYIILPAILTQEQDIDQLTLAFGVRHGVTDKLEINAGVSVAGSETRIVNIDDSIDEQTDFGVNSVDVGATYRFSEDNMTPSLTGSVNVTVVESLALGTSDYENLKSMSIFLSSHRVVDPLVLRLSGGLRLNLERPRGGGDVDPGEIFVLQPSIVFLANDTTTINGGFVLQHQLKDEGDGVISEIATTTAQLEFGVGHAVSDRMTLRGRASAPAGGNSSFTAGLSLEYAF